jgi:sugar (pentulose or hexulose) kinase
MLADLLGVPVTVPSVVAGEALGAAICAAAATGAVGDITAAAAAMAPQRREFLPDPAVHAAYRSGALLRDDTEAVPSIPGAR